MRVSQLARLLVWIAPLVGCGAAAKVEASAGGMAPPTAPQHYSAGADNELIAQAAPSSESTVRVDAAAAAAPEAAPPSAPAPAGAAPPAVQTAAPTESSPATQTEAVAKTMLDIEARLAIQVQDVAAAAERLRKMTAQGGGQVVDESLQQVAAAEAQFTLRMPAGAASDFIAALEGLGAITSRHVTAKDIGKQYFDANLRLVNLESVLRRYEQILQQATNVPDMLRIEQEIARVRSEIEQIKGELRWMRDRAARATIYITLRGPETAPPPSIVNPEASFYPGVRVSYLRDFRGDQGTAGYAGAGLSLRLNRHFSFDVEGLRAVSSESDDLDLLLLTIGGELYSEFLGGGRRKWLNPFVGFRGGYARFLGKDEVSLGGTVGLEVFKTETVTIELDVRGYGMFGTSDGAHGVIQPGAGVNVAF